MPQLEIEFTNNTLVVTEQGVERLEDILHRPVSQCLWAIKWVYGALPNGISFHRSHKLAKSFAAMQIDSKPEGCARLVDVSAYLYDCVQKHGYCWTNLTSFAEAETYEGESWNH